MKVISLTRLQEFMTLLKTAIVHYGTCSTDAGLANKVANITPGYGTLVTGTQVLINFANKNTATNPQLTISGVAGNYPIYTLDGEIKESYQTNILYGYCHLVFDGLHWVVVSSSGKTRNNIVYTTSAPPSNAADGTIWLKKKEVSS